MASPFQNNKKARRRYRKDAQKEAAWANKHELSGDKPDGAIEGLRFLAKYNTVMARIKKRKKTS